MVKMKMLMGARVDDQTIAAPGDEVEVTPGTARILLESGKAELLKDEELPTGGVLTSQDPTVETREPRSARRGR